MAIDPEAGTARQQLGEIRGTLTAINDQFREHRQFIVEQLREQRLEAQRMEERLSGHISGVRSETRQDVTSQNGKMDLLTVQVRALEETTRDLLREFVNVKSDVSDSKKDLTELKETKNRLWHYASAMIALFTLISWVIGPYIASWLKSAAGKLF